MGMNLAGFRKFMTLADTTMGNLFPARVKIGGVEYAASGVGGASLNQYFDGGNASQGSRYFRIEKELLGEVVLKSGLVLEWLDAAGPVRMFTIMEAPDRPHETSQTIRCEPLQR